MPSLADLWVSLTADTSGFKKPLDDAAKEIDQLNEKISSFGSGIAQVAIGSGLALFAEKAAEKLAELGKAAFEAAETVETSLRSMARATGETGTALEGLGESFQTVFAGSSQSAEAITSALSTLTIRTGETGKALEELTSANLTFAKVTGTDVKEAVQATQRVFAEWGVAVADQKDALDSLYVVTTKTGISAQSLADNLRSAGPALKSFGFSFEEAAALIGNFEKTTGDASGAISGLTRVMATWAKQGIDDPRDALDTLVSAMKNAATEADAVGIAVQNGFVRGAAVQIADAARNGAFEIGHLAEAATNAQGALDKAAGAVGNWNAEWTKLEHQMDLVLSKLGSPFLNALTTAAHGLTEFLKLLPWNQEDTFAKYDEFLKKLQGGGDSSSFDKVNEALRQAQLNGKSFGDAVASLPASMKIAGDSALDFGIKVVGLNEHLGKTPAQIAAAAAAAKASLAAYAAAYKELLAAQKEEEREQAQVNSILQEFGVITKNDASIAKWQKDIETLNVGLKDGLVTWQQFTGALKAFNDQVLNLRFGEIAQEIIAFNQAVQSTPSDLEELARTSTAAQQAADLLGLTLQNKVVPELEMALPAGVMSVEAAMKRLKLTTDETGQATTLDIQALNAVLGDSTKSLDTVELAWGKVSSQLQRLGRTDLPLLEQEYSKMIDALAARGASTGQILALEQQELQTVIAIKAQRGESATAEIIALDVLRDKTEALSFATRGLGDLYVKIKGDFEQAFLALGKGIADAIVDGKSLGDVFTQVGKQIVKTLVEDIVGYGFKSLDVAIKSSIDNAGGLAKVLGKLGVPGLGGSGSSPVQVPTGIGEDLPNVDSLPGQTGPSSADAGSSLGSIAGIAGAIAAIGSGITQGIQMSRLINLTGEIEISTRQCKEQLIHIQDTLNQWLPKLDYMADIWGDVATIKYLVNAMLANQTDVAKGSGGAPRTIEDVAQALDDVKNSAIILNNAERDTSSATYDTGTAISHLGTVTGSLSESVGQATRTLVELSASSTSLSQTFDFLGETQPAGTQASFAPTGLIPGATSEIDKAVAQFSASLQQQAANNTAAMQAVSTAATKVVYDLGGLSGAARDAIDALVRNAPAGTTFEARDKAGNLIASGHVNKLTQPGVMAAPVDAAAATAAFHQQLLTQQLIGQMGSWGFQDPNNPTVPPLIPGLPFLPWDPRPIGGNAAGGTSITANSGGNQTVTNNITVKDAEGMVQVLRKYGMRF